MNKKIEINEQEKNIIIYCVEESYKADIEKNNIYRSEITKYILDKLHAIKDKEVAAGIFSESYFF